MKALGLLVSDKIFENGIFKRSKPEPNEELGYRNTQTSENYKSSS